MIIYENECVNCKSMGLFCMGSACPKRRVAHLYCDKCGEEEILYKYGGGEYCIYCIEGMLEEVSL